MPSARDTKSMLESPDPYRAGAAFFAWLSKLGGQEESYLCRIQWNSNKIDYPTRELDGKDLNGFLEYIGQELIVEKDDIIELTPKGVEWATKWANFYGFSRQRHIDVFKECMRRAIL